MTFGNSADQRQAMVAIRALAQAESECAALLRGALEKGDQGFPLAAATVLAALDGPGQQVLVSSLGHADPVVRWAALRGLARMGPQATGFVSQIRPLLDDPAEEVRAAAALALGQIAPNGADLSEIVYAHFSDLPLGMQLDLITTVLAAGRDALPWLREGLRSADPDRQHLALWSLAYLDDEALEALDEMVAVVSGEPGYGESGWLVLTRLAARHPEILPRLAQAMAALSGASLTAGIQATEELPLALKQSLALLYLEALTDPSNTARLAAASQLCELEGYGLETAAVMWEVAQSPDKFERLSAFGWLVRLGDAGRPHIARGLASPDSAVVAGALAALGVSGADAAPFIPDLAAFITDSRLEVWQAAAKALEDLGPVAADAVPALIAGLASGNYGLRAACADALGTAGADSAEAIHALTSLLSLDDVVLVDCAIRALGRIGPRARAAIPALEALADEDWFGPQARAALSKIRDTGPVAP